MSKKGENLAVFGWIVALVATLGSLYFSEVRQFIPCELCWYQRILMYPIVIILLVGVIRKDRNAFLYSLIFSGIGFLTSLYHYGIQKIDFLQNSAPSCGQVSCTGTYIDWAGFITIPFMAGVAFLIILMISIIGLKQTKGV